MSARSGTPASSGVVVVDLDDDAQLRALQTLNRQAYRVEADLIGFERIPGLVESLDELRACGEEFHAWVEDGRPLAAISFRRQGGLLDIHRLVVDPEAFRRGLGRRLLRHVLALPGLSEAVVGTAAANLPACRLYESEGFALSERFSVPPGLALVRFSKVLATGGNLTSAAGGG